MLARALQLFFFAIELVIVSDHFPATNPRSHEPGVHKAGKRSGQGVHGQSHDGEVTVWREA